MFDPRTRVLVVDDMPTVRRLIIKICREAGFSNVHEAGDVGQAWETLNAANPPFGLIICDLEMPGNSGIELLKRVRADGRYSRISFVMMMTEAEQAMVSDAARAGASSYVVKPFTAELLKERLESVHKKMVGG